MLRLFANTGLLTRFILHRDRIRLTVWILAIAVATIAIAAVLPDLYATGVERQLMAETMKNPAVTVMLGPGYGLDDYHDGAMFAHFMLLFTTIPAAIMGILLTVRHTREDEEAGRIEMIRSLPVGPLAPLMATMIVMLLTNIVLSLVMGFGLSALGFTSMNLGGSLLYGAVVGVTGICFAALTGLFAQLTSNARSTIGFSFGVLILAFIVRGIGDVASEPLSLLSPLGLVLRTEVYVNNYWWPVLVTLLVAGIIFGVALYLNSIRDLGQGFIPTRPGKSKAAKSLLSPLGLALRLQRTGIITWIIVMFILGVSYGSILGDLEGFLDSSELIQQMVPAAEGFNITERFVTMLMTVLSIIGVIPVLMFILKLLGEEKQHRMEHLYARSVSRGEVLGSYTLIALVAAPIIQLMSVLGLWSAALLVMENVFSLNTLLKAAMVHVPAIWFIVGVAVLLIGWFPKLTWLTWLYLGYSFFVVYLGELLQTPAWMDRITPFGYIPQIPMDPISPWIIIGMTLLSFLLIGIGYIGYNRRDIQA